MARRRFFVPGIHSGMAELRGEEAEHLVRVLRAEVGQLYELSDNRQAYLAEVEVARKAVVSFRIKEKLPDQPIGVDVTLVAALIKFDRFEWLIEKATELGVTTIQPFEAVRTERGLAQAAIKRSARWEKIAMEASQQSRRLQLPILLRPVRFAEALTVEANARLVLDERKGTLPVMQNLPKEKKPNDRVALLLGPEGGWTEEEHAQAAAADWKSCSLGGTILRTETAGIAGLAIIRAAWDGAV